VAHIRQEPAFGHIGGFRGSLGLKQRGFRALATDDVVSDFGRFDDPAVRILEGGDGH